MIVVAGSLAEGPVARVMEEAAALGIDTVLLDESHAADWDLVVEASARGMRAEAVHRGAKVDLTQASGMYLRMTLPRQVGLPPDPLTMARHHAAVALLNAWADNAPHRVANRPTPMCSNASKPYQGALIRAAGFGVPETLVTNDAEAVRAFQQKFGRVVYKSTSGVRSIVHELTTTGANRLDRVAHLPTQFQRLLTGVNIRVHVVGDEVHACAIHASTVDYRYSEGGPGSQMEPTTLPDEVRTQCLTLSRTLELPLAGIDLLRDDAGQWWCFEVNPSPAFNCFEEPTGLPIARSLVRWLADGATAACDAVVDSTGVHGTVARS